MGKRSEKSFTSAQLNNLKILFCTNAFDQVSNAPANFAKFLIGRKTSEAEIRLLTEDSDGKTKDVYQLKLNIKKLFKPFGQFIWIWKYYNASHYI